MIHVSFIFFLFHELELLLDPVGGETGSVTETTSRSSSFTGTARTRVTQIQKTSFTTSTRKKGRKKTESARKETSVSVIQDTDRKEYQPVLSSPCRADLALVENQAGTDVDPKAR